MWLPSEYDKVQNSLENLRLLFLENGDVNINEIKDILLSKYYLNCNITNIIWNILKG